MNIGFVIIDVNIGFVNIGFMNIGFVNIGFVNIGFVDPRCCLLYTSPSPRD